MEPGRCREFDLTRGWWTPAGDTALAKYDGHWSAMPFQRESSKAPSGR